MKMRREDNKEKLRTNKETEETGREVAVKVLF